MNQHLPVRLARPRLAAGLLVSLALLGTACSTDSKDVAALSGPTLLASKVASTPSPVTSTLGGAANFAILGNAAVTCTNGTITGNVGTFQAVPLGAVTQTTCPIVGQIHVGDATAIAAYNAFLNAYTGLAPKLGDVCPIITGTLAGQILAPGVYCVSAEAKTGVLTLNGPATGTWTIKVAPGAFTGTSFSVVMAGGAQACNVTWWVDAATTLTDSDLKGTILSGAAITLTRGTLIGRAFAKAGVTVTGTAVTGCVGGSTGGGTGSGDGDNDGDKGGDDGHGDRGHHDKDNHNDRDKHDGDKHDGDKGSDNDRE
jgi:hypothetical protein